jgi:hypothetical protein
MNNSPVLDRCIKCPKCQKKTMRKSIPEKFGMEWFCDQCHEYFGTNELVFNWNYDSGDFYGKESETPHILIMERYFNKILPDNLMFHWIDYDDEIIAEVPFFPFQDEPFWNSEKERFEAYEMVERMFLDIPEWSMENNDIDYGYPI